MKTKNSLNNVRSVIMIACDTKIKCVIKFNWNIEREKMFGLTWCILKKIIKYLITERTDVVRMHCTVYMQSADIRVKMHSMMLKGRQIWQAYYYVFRNRFAFLKLLNTEIIASPDENRFAYFYEWLIKEILCFLNLKR